MFTQLMDNACRYHRLHPLPLSHQRRSSAKHVVICKILLLIAFLGRMKCLRATGTIVDAFEFDEKSSQTKNFSMKTLRTNIDMEQLWTTQAVITLAGYPVEVHEVTTRDGFVLDLHRLPQPGHQPILLLHGLYGSSMDFVILGPNVSMAYALWDNDYDVWLGNCRGNLYAQQHTHYTTDDLKFWNFSFDDIGTYDLPAIMDYIRSNTSFHEMHVVAHSQGAAALLVLLSELPEYNERLGIVQFLAPLVYLRHNKVDPNYRRFVSDFLKSPESREVREFMPKGFWESLNCFSNRILQLSCLQIIFEFVGRDMQQLQQSKVNLLLKQFPAGGSVKQLRHYYQIYNAGVFQHYDYGFEGNFDKYVAAEPPSYDLAKITASIFVHLAQNDHLSSQEDVQKLIRDLPTVFGSHSVPHPGFNHLDFIWAKDLRKLVIEKVLQVFADCRGSLYCTQKNS